MPVSQREPQLSPAQFALIVVNLSLALFFVQALPHVRWGEWVQFSIWGLGGLLLSRALILRARVVPNSLRELVTMGCWGLYAVLLSEAFLIPTLFGLACGVCFVTREYWKEQTQASTPPRASVSLSMSTEIDEPTDEETAQDIDRSLENRLLSGVANSTEADSEEPESLCQFEPEDRLVVQHTERGVNKDGSEWMEGTVLVQFNQGQRTAIVHLPFWPAFASIPSVECELLSGPELRVEVKAVLRWGMRIEVVRKARGLDPGSAELAIYLSSQAAMSEAA